MPAWWAVILIVLVVFDSDVESESDFQNGSTNKKSAAADGSDLEDDFDFYGWIKPCKDITNRTDKYEGNYVSSYDDSTNEISLSHW